MDTQFKKGVMDICVLSLLGKKDYYGYELVNKLSEIILISEGTLYPILKRLKNEGYLETYLRESKEGPSRKYYSLTKKGKMKSKELNKEWKEFSKKIDKILKEK
ncbi:MAG: PadR family transcriptional regulator [Candidatus Pacearchaeota archaeon]|nr:PadR family transcriptional regulator [Candidatus Pacearchaeota archaeon]